MGKNIIPSGGGHANGGDFVTCGRDPRRRHSSSPPEPEQLLATAEALYDEADELEEAVAGGAGPFAPHLTPEETLQLARDLRADARDLERRAGKAVDNNGFAAWLLQYGPDGPGLWEKAGEGADPSELLNGFRHYYTPNSRRRPCWVAVTAAATPPAKPAENGSVPGAHCWLLWKEGKRREEVEYGE